MLGAMGLLQNDALFNDCRKRRIWPGSMLVVV